MIISHLLRQQDTSDSWMQIPKIIYPDRENITGYVCSGWNVKPKEPRIKGKVVFLINARAISYAESVMGYIEHYKLGEIVGQPTAGTNGNVNPFRLPGNFTISWTGMKVVKHDGSQQHLIGILPTVPVQRTIKGVMEGRDEYLEKALEIINRKAEP
jgi:C-terminal processing protease CtpA/Prc